MFAPTPLRVALSSHIITGGSKLEHELEKTYPALYAGLRQFRVAALRRIKRHIDAGKPMLVAGPIVQRRDDGKVKSG